MSIKANTRQHEEAHAVKAKIARISQADVPAVDLQSALRVPKALFESYASSPTKPINVATAMGISPGSSNFRTITGAAVAYGLTDAAYNSAAIGMTELAKRIFSPVREGQDQEAMREAFLKPRVISEFIRKYDGSALPAENIAINVLVEMGVPRERGLETIKLITEGSRSLGLVSEIKGKTYLNLSAVSGIETSETDPRTEEGHQARPVHFSQESDVLSSESESASSLKSHIPTAPSNRKVFITHGKNRAFVDPLKRLLQFGELEAVVSVEKQSVSVPVTEKVMQDMRDCSAAIIHVDSEMMFVDKDGEQHAGLNPNVLIEIGAALALYGKRFILLVKSGVNLPSNLQGLYEVRYSDDKLDGDATIRLMEAINELKRHPPV